MRPCLAALALVPLAATRLLAAPTTPTPSAPLPIRRVTLYTSGVGYFERSGTVDGDATQTLLFPTGQINDVLKSLVLLDTGGGTIQPVTYAAQDPLARQLQNFSVDLSDNPDRASLLNRLRGTSVTVTTAQGVVAGTIIGVETKTVTLPNNGGTTEKSLLTLDADDGLHTIPLADVTVLKINDPQVNEELSKELAMVAQGRDAGKRPVTLSFRGHGSRTVAVGYLTETPLWQTTYRLVLGKTPALQGWALVQNTSQDDWNNVQLTLASGRPISFIQDLYTPQYVPRPVVAPRVTASPTPQTYASNLDQTQQNAANAPVASPPPPNVNHVYANEGGGMMGGMGGYGGGGFGGALGGMGGIAPNGGTVMNGAPFQKQISTKLNLSSIAMQGEKLGTAIFTYAIKVPVSVPRGQSAMIPFVSGAIQAEPVAIYDSSVQADHPLMGARIKNTTGLHLMGGPITVFDQNAGGTDYVGDALINDTEPGQSRLISYALDLAVAASVETTENDRRDTMLTISQGVLDISSIEQHANLYTFKNNSSAAQTVVVEMPYEGADWTLLEPKKETERTATQLRFDVPVPAGASKKFTVRQQHQTAESVALLGADTSTIVAFSNYTIATPAVKAALLQIVRQRQAIADTQAKINDLNARIQDIGNGQTRIRDNMKALDHSSALYKRYVGELNTQETTLETLQSQQDALQTQLAQQKDTLNTYVAHLNVQ